jgi:dihydrofolate reductase
MRVYIIAALTADGFIGMSENHLATTWTSKEDKKHMTEMTKESGVVIMGGNTYRTINRALPGRRSIVYTHQKIEGVDGVEATQDAPDKLIARLEREGYESVAIFGGQSVYDLFLQAGLVDDLYITVEPLLFGEGVPLVKSRMTVELQLKAQQKLNESTLLLHYEVVK